MALFGHGSDDGVGLSAEAELARKVQVTGVYHPLIDVRQVDMATFTKIC